MAELRSLPPLAGRALVEHAGHSLTTRRALFVVAVRSRVSLDLPDDARRALDEWLLIGPDREALLAQAAAAEPALVTNLSDGFAFIELDGPEALALLGISPIATLAEGTLTTRVADLRVTLRYRRDPAAALLVVERFSADYLWDWLVDRLSTAGSTSAAPAL